MIPTKICRGVAIASAFSFLVPPMLLVTILGSWTAFSGESCNLASRLANWLVAGTFAFALLTCFWVPSQNRLRLTVTVMNALLITFCVILDLGMLMGVLSLKN
jgi:hypothetical protein